MPPDPSAGPSSGPSPENWGHDLEGLENTIKIGVYFQDQVFVFKMRSSSQDQVVFIKIRG
jgi:hypothetical protein